MESSENKKRLCKRKNKNKKRRCNALKDYDKENKDVFLVRRSEKITMTNKLGFFICNRFWAL